MIITKKSSPTPESKATTPEATAAEQSGPGQTASAGAAKGTAKFQLVPPLSDEDRHHLRESIRRYGVQVPVEEDEDGELLDGFHRVELCAELGIDCPRRVIANLGDDQAKREYARGINLARRHLTPEKKRQLISEQLADTPDRSNRQVAKALGVSHHTVGEVRGKLEATGQIAQLAKTIGRDGRARRLHMNSAAPKRPKQTEVMLTELHHLAGHCREIAPDKFLPGLASETRRQEALGSMRIVGGWIEEILPAEPWQEGKMPPEKAG